MNDIAHEETELALKVMERKVSNVYLQASKEVKAKLDDYVRRFEIKDKLKQQAVKDGKITNKEYQDWLKGQLMMEKRWREMLDTVATDYVNADKLARSIIFDYQPSVYALNHNYGTFQVEKGALVDTSYTLYDAQTVERLFKDDKGSFIPAPGKKLRKEIDEGRAFEWNKQRVQSAMLQSIIQGESIGNIASRVSREVGDYDRKAMIRNARTITTGVENAGRVDSYKRANEMGIETQKQWLATLDSRTRHWHRELDGVAVDNDKPFENEYGEIMYPGDPTAEPGNIYNCRCTLIACIKGFERDLSDLSLRRDENLGDMTYEEWKAEKESTSDPITKQDEIESNIRKAYNSLYKYYSKKDK